MAKRLAYEFIDELRRATKEGMTVEGENKWMEGTVKTVATSYRENNGQAIRDFIGALKEYNVVQDLTAEEAQESALRYLDCRCAVMDRAVEGKFDGRLRAFFRKSAGYEPDEITELTRTMALLKEEEERRSK